MILDIYITYFLVPHSVSVQEHNHHYLKGLSQGLNISYRKTQIKYKINIKYDLPATYIVPLILMQLHCCIGFHFFKLIYFEFLAFYSL